MPNYGRSGRCLTCKRRRVKCDEARPACSPCRRLGLDCGGYTKDYAFRDESHRFASAATLKTLKEQGALVHRSAAAGEPSRSLLTGADVAVPFFLVHYAGMGRSLAVARGFYETLIPMYTSQPHDSPLSLAVSAVAARVFSLWRHEDAAQVEPHLAPYTQAVASLRSALERPEDRRRPATTLAVLALHLYESISAVYDARQATPVHHHGALSLLPIAALDSLDGLISTYVKGFVLHTEISSALRQKRSMHPNVYSYVNSPHTSSLVPGNFSSTLDSIGASVAELQADYVRGLSRRHASGPLLEQQCRAWITEAGQIDELLRAWARDVPDHWRPLRLTSGQDFSPSITAYRSACDIYPSCQIATLWNLWRFHRLLLLKITVGATQRISTLPRDESAGDERLVPTTMESAIQAGSIQELVDSICHSVPFYLGNRTKQSSLSDFTDPEILFPSYHLLTPGDARIAARHQDCDDAALSGDEQHRHIVAYGAWHIVSPLSNLLTLVSDDHGGRLVASCLRLGQQEWIREQFLRVSTLVRLPAAGPFGGEKGRSPPLLPVDPKSADSAAESLAKQVRKGAIFMSGP
ncbi:hypothetical protein ABVK25_000355 [Lepraria finkii]|uniref:Zn(2)-C6 fungal-type domain-containing protein n=1 Tax=Lepraria finkii TaxID=1340010 RepID=A0ABR4BRP8_9LECA